MIVMDSKSLSTEEAKSLVKKNLLENPRIVPASPGEAENNKRWCAAMSLRNKDYVSVFIDDGNGERRYESPQEAHDFLSSLGFKEDDIMFYMTLTDPPEFVC